MYASEILHPRACDKALLLKAICASCLYYARLKHENNLTRLIFFLSFSFTLVVRVNETE